MKMIQILSSILFASALAFTLAGCDRDGPAEHAGERIDDAMEDASDAIKDMGDSIDDAFNNNRDDTPDPDPNGQY